MSGKRLFVSVLLLVTTLAASALAQDEKNELSGVYGVHFVSNQGIHGYTGANPVIASGNSSTIEAVYARQFLVEPAYSISAEGIFAFVPDQDLNAGGYQKGIVPSDLKQYFVVPAAKVSIFPTTAVSPWVSFGVGVGHISQSSTLVYGGANPGRATTSAVIEGGFGFQVKVWSRLGLRADVRDFWGGEPDYPLAPTGKTRQHNFLVGVGVYWRF